MNIDATPFRLEDKLNGLLQSWRDCPLRNASTSGVAALAGR